MVQMLRYILPLIARPHDLLQRGLVSSVMVAIGFDPLTILLIFIRAPGHQGQSAYEFGRSCSPATTTPLPLKTTDPIIFNNPVVQSSSS